MRRGRWLYRLKRPVCRVVGHSWSAWHTGGYLIWTRRLGHENRICFRCDTNEFRPERSSR